MRQRPVVLAVTLCAALSSGCAVDPQTGQPSFKETFASDDPCANNARNTGVLIGALAGAIIGNQIDKSTKGRLLGATAGALAGGLIGNDLDRRQCELARIAKKYDLQVEIASLGPEGATMETAPFPAKDEKPQQAAGLSVSIRDAEGAGGHFELGSDQLTARAREYFSAIAEQYKPQANAAKFADQKQRAEYLDQAQKRRIFLVGHTDDTGSPKANADLSERRAKAVARHLVEQGVTEQNVYYQGAGETHPVADNATDEGRAKNRRVEIVELANEATFRKYLAARPVHYEFLRPQAAAVAGSSSPAMNAGRTPPPSTTKASRRDTDTAATVRRPAPIRNSIDFGGVPYTESEATVEVGKMLEEGGFSLVSKAHADKPGVVTSCRHDRPRMAGSIRSLADGKVYSTNEHLPGLHGRTWFDMVGGHLVVLNKVSVLREGATPDTLPDFKIYRKYDVAKKGGAVAEVNVTPQVNTYLGSKGLLYRVFLDGQAGIRCADVLFPSAAPFQAQAGRLIYAGAEGDFVARFAPRIQD